MLRLKSRRCGHQRCDFRGDAASSSSFSRLVKISETPKMPTAIPTKSMPLRSSLKPKVNRVALVKTSEPDEPEQHADKSHRHAFQHRPVRQGNHENKAEQGERKYSGAPNATAIRASGGAKAASTKVAIQPAMNDPIAAIASATPARPCRAI